MENGKTSLLLTLVAAVLASGALLLIQPYSADFPGTQYAKPARRFLRAAIHRDSADLQRLSASATAVDWALHVAGAHPDSLASWAGRTHTYVTARRGDTTEVLVYPAAEPCSDVPVVLAFVGTRSRAKVVKASSACLPPR